MWDRFWTFINDTFKIYVNRFYPNGLPRRFRRNPRILNDKLLEFIKNLKGGEIEVVLAIIQYVHSMNAVDAIIYYSFGAHSLWLARVMSKGSKAIRELLRKATPINEGLAWPVVVVSGNETICPEILILQYLYKLLLSSKSPEQQKEITATICGLNLRSVRVIMCFLALLTFLYVNNLPAFLTLLEKLIELIKSS